MLSLEDDFATARISREKSGLGTDFVFQWNQTYLGAMMATPEQKRSYWNAGYIVGLGAMRVIKGLVLVYDRLD